MVRLTDADKKIIREALTEMRETLEKWSGAHLATEAERELWQLKIEQIDQALSRLEGLPKG